MSIKDFLIFFVIISLSHNTCGTDTDNSPRTKLKAVYVTVRAGQTEKPEKEWDTKTNVNKDFMEKVKLSEQGRETIYGLGKAVSEYYKSKFDQREITLSSKGCAERRCQASAALFKKGFQNMQSFDKQKEVAEEDMKGTYNADQANQRGRFYTNCTAFMKNSITSVTKMWSGATHERFKNTIRIIKQNLEQNAKYDNPYFLWMAWESFYSMSQEKPKWMTETVKRDLVKISGLYFKAALSSKIARKLSAGTIVNEIISDTSNFDDEDSEKITVYVAPLPELEAIAAAFSGPKGYYKSAKNDKIWNGWSYLPHGSLMAVEIHELLNSRGDDSAQYGLKILFLIGNSTLSDSSAVYIRGCEHEICPLETVTNLLKDYTIDTNQLDLFCTKEE